MIYVSMIFIILFWFMALIMMLLPGKLPRGMAFFLLIFELPLISGRQTLWLESPLQIVTISLPALDALYGYIFFLAWAFIAWVNYMETIGRDFLVRKRKPVT